MRNRFLALVVLSLAGIGEAQDAPRKAAEFPRLPEILDPQTYSSPSGAFLLSVDPEQVLGIGGAMVRLEERVLGDHYVERFTTRLPFAFQLAAVSDDGISCGFALTRGKNGLGELVIAVVDPEGSVVNEHKTSRRTSRYLHGPIWPGPRALVLEPEFGRFSVNIAYPDEETRSAWWSYSLTSGEQLEAIDPPIDSSRLVTSTAHPLGRVEADVTEVSLEALGVIVLEHVPELEAKTDESVPATGSLRRSRPVEKIAHHVIDGVGRPYILDSTTGAVHAFAADGHHRFSVRPNPQESFESRTRAELIGDSKGGVWARLHQEVWEPRKPFVHFDATGQRIELRAVDRSILAAISDGETWIAEGTQDGRLLQFDEEGRAVRIIERFPDRRFVGWIAAGAATRDDELVCLSRGTLLFVKPGGLPQAIRLPSGLPSAHRLAASSEWVILFDRSAAVVLYRRKDSAFLVWDRGDLETRNRWSYGFSADGKELLALESPALLIHRFAPP